MRAFLLATTLLATPAFADTILATSQITAVTIYPQGAEVTRQVEFTAPAGLHEVLITDLPLDTEPTGLRLSSADTALGAFSLRTDRQPPRDDQQSPEMQQAEAAIDLADEKLRQAQTTVAAIAAEVEAQEAQIAFLTKVKLDAGGATAESLAGIAQMIGTQVLAARQAALSAQDGLPEAEKAVSDAQEELAKAQAAAKALSQRDENYAALSVAVEVTGTSPAHLTITSITEYAQWVPVYDMALDRKAGKIAVKRGVLVGQDSGEDWAGVALTLSTARPSDQSAASQLYPELRSVYEPGQDMPKDMARNVTAGAAMESAPEPAAPPQSVTATMDYQGDTVVYHYPTAVDVAAGVEDLRLELDEVTLSAEVVARAVPRYDQTAFLAAKFKNDAPDILLPGDAYLYRDGVLTGTTYLDAVAPGDEADLSFGAIDGLRLKRDMPLRAEGDRGVFTSSTQIEEKATLEIENLTDESWPVRLLDQVPYSEQEELEISFRADPEPTEQDVEGDRGVLAWDFDLAPGEKKEVTLETVMSWPEGKELQ